MNKEKFKNLIVYLILIATVFYALPLLISDTSSAMYILLVVLPLICIAISFIYGLNHANVVIYSVCTALLFIPVVFIYLNATALIYVIFYGLIAMISSLTGKSITAYVGSRKKIKDEK